MWDHTFAWNKNAYGGTEYMAKGWHKYISADMPKIKNYLALVAPGDNPDFSYLLKSDKPIIFWLHNIADQFGPNEISFLSSKAFIDKLKYLIVPSEFAKTETLEKTSIPADKIYVIPNAIKPLKYNPEKFKNPGKLKLINTSNPYRGLDILSNAITKLSPKDFDFEVDVFSGFNPSQVEGFEPDPRINFYGFSHKSTVTKHVEAAHIHAYPSNYLETFCISQVEAMSAGLLCLTSDIAALPEVSGNFGINYPYVDDKMEHAKLFAEKLANTFEIIKSEKWNPQEQIEYVNKKYSWDAVKQQWLAFHELL